MKQAIKAIRIVHGITTEYNQNDCNILNTIAKLLIKHGAISSERLQGITGFQSITVGWALWHLEAKESKAQLWTLPDYED